MIDLSKITFVSSPWDCHPGATRIAGGIKITCQVTIDDSRNEPEARDAIRRTIWDNVYGDLRGPFAELEDFALTGARNHNELQRVTEVCARIRKLLAAPKV